MKKVFQMPIFGHARLLEQKPKFNLQNNCFVRKLMKTRLLEKSKKT